MTFSFSSSITVFEQGTFAHYNMHANKLCRNYRYSNPLRTFQFARIELLSCYLLSILSILLRIAFFVVAMPPLKRLQLSKKSRQLLKLRQNRERTNACRNNSECLHFTAFSEATCTSAHHCIQRVHLTSIDLVLFWRRLHESCFVVQPAYAPSKMVEHFRLGMQPVVCNAMKNATLLASWVWKSFSLGLLLAND